MKRSQPISGKGFLRVVCSVLLAFQPVLGAQEPTTIATTMVIAHPLLSPIAEIHTPESVAVAKLTGSADRNDQPLLNGSVITSGDSLRTHIDSALLLTSAPGERLWLGSNTSAKVTKDAGSVRVVLARGTLAFQTRGNIQVTIEHHEGMALRSRPETSVLAQLSLVNDQEAQVRVQQGYLELVEGGRSVLLQPDQPSRIPSTANRQPAATTTSRELDEQEATSSPSDTGTVNGTVVDSQLFVVSDANVTLTSATGKTLTSVTNYGKFSFTNVPSGKYTLRVTKTKFHTYELKDVVVRGGNESSLFVHLASGAAGSNSNNLLIWVIVGGAAAGGIGAYAATRGSSSSSNSPSTTQ